MKGRKVNPLDIFTPKMVADAKLCANTDEILEKVIAPNMSLINERTGQQNDPRFWAYAMEFTLMRLKEQEAGQ
jgi:hypothetical protein